MRLFELIASRKLHDRVIFRGLKISVENRKGSVRSGTDADGKDWSMFYTIPYGYIRGTMGVDGDHVDCFVGPNQDAENVYVIHTKNPKTGRYDEDKCMLGFKTAQDAKYAFLRHYTSSKFFGSMDTIPFEDFRRKALGTKDAPSKIVASVGISVGDQVIVDGIKYRMVVKKIKGRMLWLEAKGPFNTYDSHTIMRPITAVQKI